LDLITLAVEPPATPVRPLILTLFSAGTTVSGATPTAIGHFPAVAEPQLLAEQLRAAFSPYRDLEAG
jgi:hypothetical protein